ncbi:MAG: GldG family protein [Candidatus Acidiferrales bacterium]
MPPKRLEPRTLAGFAGWIGLAMLAAGGIRYSVEEVLSTFTRVLLIAGPALIVVGVVFNYRDFLTYFRKRSARLGSNVAVLIVSVLAILVALNFIGYKHHKRFDLTSEKLYTLSDQTLTIVRGLKEDVNVIRFSKDPDPDLADRINSYKDASPHVHYESVDPQEHPELAKQYGVAGPGQVVVVTNGKQTERLENPTEQYITGALLKVTSATQKTVCFVEGHGEKSISDSGPRGYSAVKGELEKENYLTKSINLVETNGVPADCSVLVEAGPTQSLFAQEAQMIETYLSNGGKAFIELDPDTDAKLDDLFKEWNIKVGDNTVIDASGIGRMFGTGPAVPLVRDYGASPITGKFQGTMSFYPLARTVEIADRNNTQVFPVELLKTSPASFAKEGKITGTTVSFDPKKDKQGPLTLGLSAEKKDGGKTARLVVIGDSDFASNQWMGLQRNGDVFFNTINWLSEQENLISIRPKSATARRVTMTEAQLTGLRWFSLVLLPGLVILSGIYIWWKRK